MKNRNLFLLFLLLACRLAAAFTEFYCDASTGVNINAGDNAVTAVTTTNGAYTRGAGAGGTDRFVAASGTPFATAVANTFVSIYADGATVTTFVGRITAVNSSTSIDIGLTAIAGTRPSDAATGVSATIGGMWKGPNGTSAFPFSFMAGVLMNAASDRPRVNLKNTSSYAVTAAMTHSTAGPITWQGYTTTPGDGGRAIIDGGTSGSAYTLLTISGTDNGWKDIIFQNNGASGGGSGTQGVSTTGSRSYFVRCVFKGFRGAGSYSASSQALFAECEAYDCNKDNVTSRAGFYAATSGSLFIRCISHGNAGSNSAGFGLDQSMSALFCVSFGNGGDGFYSQADQYVNIINCDAYNNAGHGFNSTPASNTLILNIQNSNFVKNGGYGIRSNSLIRSGVIYNNGFGSGSQANTSGDIIAGLTPVEISGTITYASGVTPWVDPANGDFRINKTAAQGTGRGNFLNTQTGSNASFISYPDVGSGIHQPSKPGIGY